MDNMQGYYFRPLWSSRGPSTPPVPTAHPTAAAEEQSSLKVLVKAFTGSPRVEGWAIPQGDTSLSPSSGRPLDGQREAAAS